MTNFSLKLFALITMFIDHIGSVVFPNHFWLRYIGRFSFPIYAFFISQGLKNTSNIKNYLRNLFLLAIISEPLYDLCFHNSINLFYQTNTVYTLFISSLSIYFFTNSINYITKYIILFLGIFFAYILKTDYDAFGVILIYMFYFINEKKLYVIYGIIWVTLKNLNNISTILYYKLNNNLYLSTTYISHSLDLYIFTILPFFIILFYNGKKGKNIKYIFYILYPLHLFVLSIIKIFLL